MMRNAFTGMLTIDFDENVRDISGSSHLSGETAPNLEGKNIKKLTAQMRQFCEQLSKFQQELYYMLLGVNEAMPVHVLMNRVKAQSHSKETAQAGIQDALVTVELLETFGLLERDVPEKIPSTRISSEDFASETHIREEYLLDHNRRPILIERFRPTRDVFEENGNATGERED